ncbi:MAG TPA: hypothetical protein VJ717_14880 [Gemmatimonadaceae bacterium]|nr:hypothetical protein [Gemmatimonadaceae bacterium]
MLNDQDNDDAPIGRILTRREALVIFGGAGAGSLLAGCVSSGGAPATTDTPSSSSGPASSSAAACVAKPQLTEGPYFVDEKLNRGDIRSDTNTGAAKTGAPLALAINVQRIQSGACTPLAGAIVDVWQCDALGVYSDARDRSFNTVGQNFLRGYQVTDASGVARFTTIVPGWYPGRASHIHFKIRQSLAPSSAYEFTSQLFFDEAFLTALYTSEAAYSSKGDAGRVRNERDGIYNQGGAQLLVTPAKATAGYTTTLIVGLNV